RSGCARGGCGSTARDRRAGRLPTATGWSPGRARRTGERRASRASFGPRRGAGLGLELADLVADRRGVLELLARAGALELVVQALDLARARRALAVAERNLAAVTRVTVDAPQQRAELELERVVALGAAQAPRLAKRRIEHAAARALDPPDALLVG